MIKFPEEISPENNKNFRKILLENCLRKLRKEIYLNIIEDCESNYFVIDNFSNSNNITDDETEYLVQTVIKELENLGWVCKLSFNNTGLFIFKNPDTPPSNYYPDGFE
jgi:hypothetical protein